MKAKDLVGKVTIINATLRFYFKDAGEVTHYLFQLDEGRRVGANQMGYENELNQEIVCSLEEVFDAVRAYHGSKVR